MQELDACTVFCLLVVMSEEGPVCGSGVSVDSNTAARPPSLQGSPLMGNLTPKWPG